MGLLKRKPKINSITDVEVFEKNDTNFYESLLGEISTGSHDVKETVITFTDRQVIIRSASGVIKSAYDTSFELTLDSRFYWSNYPAIKESDIKDLLGLTTAQLFEQYPIFVETFPESKDFLSSALRAYVVTVLRKTVDDFSNHEKVRTELINETAISRCVIGNDFFDMKVTLIEPMIAKLQEAEDSVLKSLSIADFKPSEIILSLESSEYEARTDAERFIVAAAESKATLEDVQKLSRGFFWFDVLEAVAKLAESDTIKVSFPGSQPELPDLLDLDKIANELSENQRDVENPFEDDEELEDKNSVLDVKPLEGIIVEPVNEPGEEYLFGSGIEEDDGSFMYELLHDDASTLSTEGVSDNIEDDVRKILDHKTVPSHVKDEIVLLLRKNNALEAELSSIEKSIADGRGHYNENVGVFEDLKFQHNVASASDDSETGRESINEEETINEKQDLSNRSFLTISKLEEERYKINVARRAILQRIAALVSEMVGEEVQGVIHRIDVKIKGIDQVTNTAFHAPEDDELEQVDPVLLVEVTSETIAAKSREFTYAQTPTFYLLATEMDFNPFELVTVD
jgi:hypothetical protein